MLRRSSFAALRRLLTARDHDAIRQGVELIVALRDEDTVERLLEGVTWQPDEVLEFKTSPYDRPEKATGALVTSGVFAGNSRDRPYFLAAVLALIDTGMGARARALQAQITHLAISAGEAPFDLRALACLRALGRLSVAAGGGLTHVGALGKLPALKELELRSGRLSIISGFAGIEHAPIWKLTMWGPAVLDGIGGPIQVIIHHHAHTSDLSPLRALPRLRYLQVSGEVSLAGLGATRIETLHAPNAKLTGYGPAPTLRTLACHDLAGLGEAPLLESVSASAFGGTGAFPSVRAIGTHRLAALVNAARRFPSVERLDASLTIPHLGALAAFPKLREIETHYIHGVQTVAGMPVVALSRGTGRPIEVLELGTAVTSLDGMPALAGVRLLSLRGATGLASLRGVERLPDLRGLDVRECVRLRDVSALEGLDLRVIAVSGCTLAEEGGFPPEHAWALVRGRNAEPERLLDRPRVAGKARRARKPAPTLAVDEAAWARAITALQERNPRTMEPHARAVLAAGPRAFERLLHGARPVEDDGVILGPKVPLRGNTGAKQDLIRWLFYLLPEGLPHLEVIRAQVRCLMVAESYASGVSGLTKGGLSLTPLQAFPNLERVDIVDADPTGMSALRGCAALRELMIHDDRWTPADVPEGIVKLGARFRTLDGIGRLAALEWLWLRGDRSIPADPVRSCRRLRELIGGHFEDPDLTMLPELTRLTLPNATDLRSGTVTTVQLTSASGAIDLRGLTGLRQLRVSLAVYEWTHSEKFEPLCRETSLVAADTVEHLDVSGPLTLVEPGRLTALTTAHVSAGTPAWLAELPALRVLRIYDSEQLAIVPSLRIEVLEACCSLRRSDLAPLAGHPTLREVKNFSQTFTPPFGP